MKYNASTTEALKKLKALNRMKHESGADVSRALKLVVSRLSPADLLTVSVVLADEKIKDDSTANFTYDPMPTSGPGQTLPLEHAGCRCKCHGPGAADGHVAPECPGCDGELK